MMLRFRTVVSIARNFCETNFRDFRRISVIKQKTILHKENEW